MAFALILDTNGFISQIGDGDALQADKLERKTTGGDLIIGFAITSGYEIKLGNTVSLVHCRGDVQIDGYIDILDESAPGNPSNGEGRIYKLTGEPGVWWINDTWGAAQDLTAFPKNYINGLECQRNATNPTYQVDISPGQCRSSDDTWNIVVASTITISLSSSGLNGLDTGSEASNTWYYFYVVYNPTTRVVGGLFSASATSPTLPSGFTKYRLLGQTRNNASSNFLGWVQFGKGRERKYYYDDENVANLQVLSGGASTSWTDINVRAFVPAPSNYGMFGYVYQGNGTYTWGRLRTNGSSVTPQFIAVAGVSSFLATATANVIFRVRTDSSGIVEYSNYTSGCESYIWVAGYIDYI